MVLFGGVPGHLLDPLADTSMITLRGALDGSTVGGFTATCERLELELSPPARFGHGAVWLRELNSMMVFGGRRDAENVPGAVLGDMWFLESRMGTSRGSTMSWYQVPAENAPPPRCHFACCELSGRSFFM